MDVGKAAREWLELLVQKPDVGNLSANISPTFSFIGIPSSVTYYEPDI